MPLTSLVFSHSLDKLIEQFSENYKTAQNDPFHPPEVIFASPVSKQWLTQELTESMQVVAGLQGKYIESYLWDCLSRDFLFEGKQQVKLLKVEVLQHHMLKLLERSTLEEIDASFLIDYLEEEGVFNETKRIQLAMKLSQLFLEYELNRPPVIGNEIEGSGGEIPGIADTWLDSKSYLDGFGKRVVSSDVLNEERWQRELYTKLFSNSGSKAKGLLHCKADIQYLTLPQLWKLRLSDDTGRLLSKSDCHVILKNLFNEKPLFLFAISSPAHFHRNLLSEISAFKPVHAYLLNPCGEFWEDLVRYKKSDNSLTEKIHEYLKLENFNFNAESINEIDELKLKATEEDNQLLRLWANAGRENITLWSHFSEYDFDYLVPKVEQTSQLTKLQSSIIERKALAQSNKADHSLMLFKAPSKVREIETIRDLIFEMLSGEGPYTLDGLKPHEVGVYFPDLTSYLGAIEQVFGASQMGRNGYLPYSILSANASHSWYTRAVESLLGLLDGEFNRANLTHFLRNPFVQDAIGVDQDAIQQWEKWIDELNIYRGYSEDDIREYGDSEPSSLKTWKLALDRMIASWMMDGALDKIEPWTDMSYADESIKVKFCDSIQKLYKSLQAFKICPTASDFQNLMMDFLNQWISIPLEFISEKPVRTQLMIRLSQFAEQSESTQLVEYTSWLKANLEGDIPGRNDAKAGHVVFGTLTHAQVLPYRVLFVAGMNAGDFPGAINPSAIDLLSSVKILGDHHSVDNNKLAFLELLLQAKEKLIFSYLARNIQKDEKLQPSSVLLELKSYLEVRKFAIHTKEISLLARDKRLIDNWMPDSVDSDVDWRVWAPRDLAYWEFTAPKIDEGVFEKQIPNVIKKSYIKSFLDSPLDFQVQKQLGLYDDDSTDVGIHAESPYSLNSLEASFITSEIVNRFLDVFMEELTAGRKYDGDIEAYVKTEVEAALASQIQKGELPEGKFQTRQVKAFKEELSLVLNKLVATYSENTTRVTDFDFKPSVKTKDKQELQFDCPQMVMCGEFLTIFKANTSKTGAGNRHMLDLWLSAMYVATFYEGDIRIQHFGFDKVAKLETMVVKSGEALKWFEMILEDINNSKYTDHIPFGTLNKLIDKKPMINFTADKITQDSFIEILEGDRSGYYQNTEMVNSINYHVPEEIFEIVERRFKAFFVGGDE